MEINIKEYNNLYGNVNLRERLKKLNDVKNLKKQYKISQVILEYINTCFLIKNRKIDLKDSDILVICEEYKKIDSDLFDLMVEVNGLYNIYDHKEIKENELDYLLFLIDKIYETIKNKYGDI